MSKSKNNAIELNKDYNWNPIPKSSSKKSKGGDITLANKNKWAANGYSYKEIAIDDSDPVLKFKDWVGQYWLKKQDVDKIRNSK